MIKLLCFVIFCVTAALAQETDGRLTRGVGDVAVSGGVQWTPQGGYETVNAFGLRYSMGVTRLVAAVADYSLDWYGNEGGGSLKLRGHEFTGGARVQVPTHSPVTPYAVGLLGGYRATARIEQGRLDVGASLTRFVYGGGAGVEVRLARWGGFRAEARIMGDRTPDWYGRAMVGLYLRHR